MGAAHGELGSVDALRCDACGQVMRDAGVAAEWVLCTGFMGGALPFQGIVSGDDYEGALHEYTICAKKNEYCSIESDHFLRYRI
jgi:hypothetical protein